MWRVATGRSVVRVSIAMLIKKGIHNSKKSTANSKKTDKKSQSILNEIVFSPDKPG
jgi:hypothetical protein